MGWDAMGRDGMRGWDMLGYRLDWAGLGWAGLGCMHEAEACTPVTVTFVTWSDLNPRTIRACPMRSGRACGHSPGSENVQHRSPAEISKGSIASFTVGFQN